MVPKGGSCASTLPTRETGIRLREQALPCNLWMQAHSHPGLWWTICYFTSLLLLLQGQRVCAAALERNLNQTPECQPPSKDVCCLLTVVWSRLFKVLLPSAAKHRSANVTEFSFWGVVKISLCNNSIKLSVYVLALHVGKTGIKRVSWWIWVFVKTDADKCFQSCRVMFKMHLPGLYKYISWNRTVKSMP